MKNTQILQLVAIIFANISTTIETFLNNLSNSSSSNSQTDNNGSGSGSGGLGTQVDIEYKHWVNYQGDSTRYYGKIVPQEGNEYIEKPIMNVVIKDYDWVNTKYYVGGGSSDETLSKHVTLQVNHHLRWSLLQNNFTARVKGENGIILSESEFKSENGGIPFTFMFPSNYIFDDSHKFELIANNTITFKDSWFGHPTADENNVDRTITLNIGDIIKLN